MRNLILCLLFNLKKCQNSQNKMKYLWDICQKYWELSEFHFTLLPTSEHFFMGKREPGKNFMMAISILTTHLISSVPARPKIFSLWYAYDFQEKIPCIKALKVVYLLVFLDDHRYSDAYMLQTQRWIPDWQFHWDGTEQFQLCWN